MSTRQSVAARASGKTVIVQCSRCGGQMHTTPSQTADRRHFFCSNRCRNRAIQLGEYKPMAPADGSLTKRERERLAKVYGVTADQLQRIRDLGLSVGQVKAMAEGRLTFAAVVRRETVMVGLQRPGGRMHG